MPINRKEFDDETFKAYRGSSLKILEFLRTNKDNAYTSKEVGEAVGVSQVSATISLRNLVNNNLVESKKPYYIAKSGAASSKKKVVKKEEEVEESESSENNEDDEE
jgi:DNA-binding IscR family transcriptional regulator